jgi:hypothetical protein
LIMYNPALIYAILHKTVTAMNARISVLFDTLQQLQHQHLAVSLLSESQLQVVFDAAQNSARHHNVNLIPDHPQDLFRIGASYIRQADEILILLHIPTAASDEVLSLYEYVPFPFPFRKNTNSPLPDLNSILSLQDLADTEHFPATSAIYFKSDYPMIAIGRNKNLNTASYRLISQAVLTACIQKSHLYLCETQQTLCKDLPGSCLGALFVQSQLGIHLHCRLKSHPLQENTYQISSTRHLVYSPTLFFTQIQCTNGSHFQKQLIDITYIYLPPLCSVELVNSTITSNGNRRISLDIPLFLPGTSPPSTSLPVS